MEVEKINVISLAPCVSDVNSCGCCKQVNVKLTSFLKCSFGYIIERFLDIKISKSDFYICCVCHSMLVKIHKFMRQIKYNNGLFEKCILDEKPWYNLKTTDPVIIDTFMPLNATSPMKTDHQKEPAVSTRTKQSPQPKHIKSEDAQIKEEDSDSTDYKDIEYIEDSIDCHSNIEFSKPEQTVTATVTADKVKKRTPKALGMNYEGKIRIIEISMDDVLKERELDRSNEKYLRLPHKCKDCIVAFQYEPGLIDHMLRKHKVQNGVKCNLCNCIFPSQMSYDIHYKRHFKRYECIACGKRSRTPSVYPLLKHYQEQHEAISYTFKCKRCDFTTDKYSEHCQHRRSHLSPVTCSYCNKTLSSTTSLNTHVRAVHENKLQGEFPCDVCGKVYGRLWSLRVHQKMHKASGNFYCEDCQSTFKTEKNLQQHLKMHSRHVTDDMMRYTCEECGKKFLMKRNLEEHFNFTHLKKSNHTCDQCSKIFKSSRSLIRHVRQVHEKFRPPKNKICDHCGRGFASTNTLNDHIRTHTGERPYQCPHCSSTFRHSAALYTHKKLLHNPNRKRS
ncbi:unnamed protein product [Leptosia nina]|uniref:C2H2-type domain-containing protein n=1 Tax=Leptosia nina TaxID=320188 RepID=A0AAV1JUK1_9NEOP